MTDPPLLAGVSQRTAARVSPDAACAPVGALGAVRDARGVTVTMADAGLIPNEFTALMRTDTAMSGVRPVMVAVVVVETPSGHTDQVPELASEYSTM